MKQMAPRVRGIARGERSVVLVLAVAMFLIWLIGDRASTAQSEATAGGTAYVPLLGGWMFLVLVLGIIILNGLFVACETAIELLTSLHVKHAANEKITLRLQDILDKQQKYVAACNLGSTIARLTLVFVTFLLARDMVNTEVLWASDGHPDYADIKLALVLSIPLLIANLILGELVPKSFASLHVSGVGNRLHSFIKITSLVFSIPASIIVWLANLLTARFGGRATFTMADAAEEQIKSLAEEAQESGEIESDEKELLHSVFEFTDTVVREVMTPRVDLEGMPVISEPADVARVIESSGHSRIPLFEETDDQIVGIIHAKDLLLAMVEGKHVDLRELMRPVLFVPENMNLQEALREMRLHRAQMAVVQDEFGGTAGIVTTEDIVEELVGEIVDEYDVEEPTLITTDEGFLVDGKTHVDDVNDQIGSSFASDEFDTIGGFVFGLFGKQPKEGDALHHDGYIFTVAETDGRRIQKLAITPAAQEQPAEA